MGEQLSLFPSEPLRTSVQQWLAFPGLRLLHKRDRHYVNVVAVYGKLLMLRCDDGTQWWEAGYSVRGCYEPVGYVPPART